MTEILQLHKDGDEMFATLPSFIDLQESPVFWLSSTQRDAIELILANVLQQEQITRLTLAVEQLEQNVAVLCGVEK